MAKKIRTFDPHNDLRSAVKEDSKRNVRNFREGQSNMYVF